MTLVSKIAILYYFKHPVFSRKIVSHVKKQESMAHMQKKEKKQSRETVPEEAKILDFLDQDFKSTIYKMFKELKETKKKKKKKKKKELKESMRTNTHQIEKIERNYI